MQLVALGTTPSTNKHCEALDLARVEDFTCFWAHTQTDGIGQQGNHWESAPGQNLTFSLVLHPTFLDAARQFRLSQCLALGVCDRLHTLLPDREVLIKWPNDIYIGNGKLCGTLISTRLAAGRVASAVCGIGLNVNQTDFPSWVPHPVALCQLAGRSLPLLPLLRSLLADIEHRYRQLRLGIDPVPDYLARLMNLGRPARYRYRNADIEATITGLDPYGHLLLSASDGQKLCCGLKEIALLD